MSPPRAPALASLARPARAGDAASLRRLRTAVRAALRDAGGNRAEAARALGVSPRALLGWLADERLAAEVGREIPATLGWRREQRESRP